MGSARTYQGTGRLGSEFISRWDLTDEEYEVCVEIEAGGEVMNEITVKSVSDALEALTEVSDHYGNLDTAQSIHLLSIHISAAKRRIEELEAQCKEQENAGQILEDVRSQCCDLHPDGFTAVDFMAVWNRQYEDRIAELESLIDRVIAAWDKDNNTGYQRWERTEVVIDDMRKAREG